MRKGLETKAPSLDSGGPICPSQPPADRGADGDPGVELRLSDRSLQSRLVRCEPSDPSRSNVEDGTAVATPAANSPQGKNPIAAVSDLLDFPFEVQPALIDSGAVFGGSVGAAVDRPFQCRSHRHDLSVPGEESPEAVAIASVKRFHPGPHGFDVLPRHRLRSIAQDRLRRVGCHQLSAPESQLARKYLSEAVGALRANPSIFARDEAAGLPSRFSGTLPPTELQRVRVCTHRRTCRRADPRPSHRKPLQIEGSNRGPDSTLATTCG